VGLFGLAVLGLLSGRNLEERLVMNLALIGALTAVAAGGLSALLGWIAGPELGEGWMLRFWKGRMGKWAFRLAGLWAPEYAEVEAMDRAFEVAGELTGPGLTRVEMRGILEALQEQADLLEQFLAPTFDPAAIAAGFRQQVRNGGSREFVVEQLEELQQLAEERGIDVKWKIEAVRRELEQG
jgi:hypothetical protein